MRRPDPKAKASVAIVQARHARELALLDSHAAGLNAAAARALEDPAELPAD